VWLSVQSPYFLSWQNISLMLVQSVPLAILCFRNALDQHQADILPAEEVGRLHAQPHQQRQKQDQGALLVAINGGQEPSP
jgi:hypothetical protein